MAKVHLVFIDEPVTAGVTSCDLVLRDTASVGLDAESRGGALRPGATTVCALDLVCAGSDAGTVLSGSFPASRDDGCRTGSGSIWAAISFSAFLRSGGAHRGLMQTRVRWYQLPSVVCTV